MNNPNSTIKSKSERMFEFFCENNENIKLLEFMILYILFPIFKKIGIHIWNRIQ